MHTITNHISTALILFVSLILAWLLTSSANAYFLREAPARCTNPEERYVDQLLDLVNTRELIRYLRTNGWVKNYVDDEQLANYILQAEQFCEGRKYVTPSLALAVMAVESRYDPDAYSGGTIGLMQLSPFYHKGRLAEFKGESASMEDFYDPTLNIATGVDYLEDIYEETATYDHIPDKEEFGLMWYNMGASAASVRYLERGEITQYARIVLNLRDNIEETLTKGDVYRAKS